jgi:hypothetical protein
MPTQRFSHPTYRRFIINPLVGRRPGAKTGKVGSFVSRSISISCSGEWKRWRRIGLPPPIPPSDRRPLRATTAATRAISRHGSLCPCGGAFLSLPRTSGTGAYSPTALHLPSSPLSMRFIECGKADIIASFARTPYPTMFRSFE